MIKDFKIIKCTRDTNLKITDSVVVEKPLKIIINNKDYITIMCTPFNLDELAIGFMFSEGLISSISDVLNYSLNLGDSLNIFNSTIKKDLDIESLSKDRVITSGSKGSIYYKSMDFMNDIHFENNIKISKFEIMDTMKTFFTRSKLFERTGGVHSVLLKNGDIEIFREDIGRHNAIDKSVGYLLINEIPIDNFVIYVSGRLSSEMISKISKASISFAISRACPTSLSISLAQKMNMTVIGFSRGDRFNIYSGFERIDLYE